MHFFFVTAAAEKEWGFNDKSLRPAQPLIYMWIVIAFAKISIHNFRSMSERKKNNKKTQFLITNTLTWTKKEFDYSTILIFYLLEGWGGE